ncbi:MAG: hypothetical protein EZS28_029464 [Streblomastix strix]|uniref:SPRY domain-containing protein n=1 Tax=Streblomastix strix TaxID=222440 RepID=A0A5J4UX07_9EUKA|nr:MAG: hypothetical protein EZS28_029464 [Streblomastix strix]
MLTFDRNDRISASDALKLPFFTGPQALAEITPEIRSIASAAQTAIQRGDKSVSIYDTNINFIFPVSSVKSIIGIDPDSDRTQINSQTPSDPVEQQIPIPTNTQQSDNLISLQQMSFVQPAVIRGDQIGQSAIVPKPLPKEQVKPKPKVLQIQQQVPPSLNPNMLVGIIPDKEHAYQQRLKIIHSDNWGSSTVAFNPIISSGIVRFGGFFEDPNYGPDFSIGIADSSAVFGSSESPFEGENEKKTVCYSEYGWISHIGEDILGNSLIELNESVSCEVNMNIFPRTLTFFYDNQEQPVSIWLYVPNSSFTINRFENVQYSSAKGVSNGKVFEWGKEWKDEENEQMKRSQ